MSGVQVDVVLDAGGSRVRGFLYEGNECLGEYAVMRPGNPRRVGLDRALGAMEEVVDGLLSRSGHPGMHRLACGVAGAGEPDWRNALSDALSRRFLVDAFVCSDAESLLEAAVPEGPVCVLIAGTGAIALMRDGQGEVHRSGGAGLPGGDPGSGLWLARQIRMQVTEDLPESLTDFDLGLLAEQRAQNGDPLSRSLFESAAHHLLALLKDLPAEPAPLVLHGGLMENTTILKERFLPLLARDIPHLRLAPSWRPPHWGALNLSRREDAGESSWWAWDVG